MELDDLKKTWTALDDKLKDKDVVDINTVSHLIAEYQSKASKGIKAIEKLNKWSLLSGIVLVAVLAAAYVIAVVHHVFDNDRLAIAGGVFAVLLLIAFCWDYHTYRLARNMNVFTMPILTVIERVNKFKQCAKRELQAVCVVIPLLAALFYWAYRIYEVAFYIQLLYVLFSIAVTVVVAEVLYYKVLYKYIDDLKKNLEDLQDLQN
jgi:hypothetical protein